MEYFQTALQGMLIVGTFLAITFAIGFGITVLLLPSDWSRYQMCLAPVVGWCVLVLALFFVNVAAPVQTGIFLVLVPAFVLDILVLLRRRSLIVWPQEGLSAGILGLGIVALALLPHVIQRSLGQIILNQDEELYYTAANYVLNFPADSGSSPWSNAFLHWRNWGWGFQYTIASVSAVSGIPTFLSYIPTAYCLLGLSVIGWYVLFRETIALSSIEASIAGYLYSLLGLPLWFAAYGYGPQMSSLIALPFGTAAIVAAIGKGGWRRYLVAGIVISAGLASFYRGIGLQYVFVITPIVLFATAQHRSLRPIARMLAIIAIALVVGLPAHIPVGQWYFVEGAIMHPEWLDLTGGGWGIPDFQPPKVMLGLDAFPIARDEEGKGPFAKFDEPLGNLADLAAALALVVAVLGLVTIGRRRPLALAVVLGTAISLAFTRYVMDYPYGYVKLMPNSAPLVYAFVLVACGNAWRSRRAVRGFRIRIISRPAVVGLLAGISILLCYNSYEAVWCNATGWGQSIPAWLPTNLHAMSQSLHRGSKVFLSGRFDYPVPADSVRPREHMLGMTDDRETFGVWARRVREIAMTELLPLDVYTWFDKGLIFSDKRRLLDDESYDYYLLAPENDARLAGLENDPRLEGLDPTDIVWSDTGLALYKTQGVVRKTSWAIYKERGSLAVLPDNPLDITISSNQIILGKQGLVRPVAVTEGRLRIGILAFDRSEATIKTANGIKKLSLESGLTWYTTPNTPLSSTVTVKPEGNARLGVVALRLLDPGSEEKDLVPSQVIRDDIYVSSTVLRLEHWLTDPFRGKKPGSV